MPTLSITKILPIFVIAASTLLWTAGARAEAASYPDHPVRLIVPFAPGGPNDVLARSVGQKLGEKWKQSVVVENRGGSATVVGTDVVARAAPDGYTLLMVSTSTAVNPSLRKKLPYDTLKDFVPVIELAESAGILVVHPSSPFRSVSDVLKFAKAHPGEITFGSGGIGTATHLSGELLGMMGRVRLTHVPYHGAGPAMVDMLANRIQMTFGAVQPTLSYVKAGKLRALAVTSLKRMPELPDVPTVAETLPGFEAVGFWGIFAPAGTPPAIVKKLNSDISHVLADSGMRDRLAAQGFEIVGGSAEAFAKRFRGELHKWADVIQKAGIAKVN